MKNTVILAALAAVTILPAAVRADDETAAEEPAVAASGSFSFGKPKAAAEAADAATDGAKADKTAGQDGDGEEAKENAFAELFSGKERAANAEKYLAERLADFPGNVVEAFLLTKEDGSPSIELEDGNVFANVGVRVNPANYAAWAARLQEVLGAVCQEQEKTNLKFGNVYGDRVQTDPVKVAPPRKPATSVTVATPGPDKVRRSTWPATVYWLEDEIWKAFLKTMDAQFPVSGTVEVVLTDEDGEPVCSKVENLKIARQPTTTGVPCFKGDCIPVCAEREFACVMPGIAPDKMSSTLFVLERKTDLTATFRIDLGEIPEEDMSEVRGFQVKLEYRKPAPKN